MRTFAGVFLIVALSACSGVATSVTPAPAPIVPSKATQRLEAQAAIVSSLGIEAATAGAIVIHDVQDLIDGTGFITYPKCKNGIETSIKPINPESFVITIDVFYEPDCTTKLAHATLKAVLFLPGNLSFTGKTTTYDKAGKPTSFGTLSNTSKITSTTASSVTQGTIALSPGGPALMSFGLTCNMTTTGTCAFGGVTAVASQKQSLGVTSTIANFVPSGPSNGTVALDAFVGALGALSLHQTGQTWSVRGGTRAASLTGTFNEKVNPKNFDIRGSLSLADAKAGLTTGNSFGTRSGIGSGLVRKTTGGTAYTSFSTDPVGSGSITYDDGTTGKISFFIVTS